MEGVDDEVDVAVKKGESGRKKRLLKKKKVSNEGEEEGSTTTTTTSTTPSPTPERLVSSSSSDFSDSHSRRKFGGKKRTFLRQEAWVGEGLHQGFFQSQADLNEVLSTKENLIISSFESMPSTRQRSILCHLIEKNKPFSGEKDDKYSSAVVQNFKPKLFESLDRWVASSASSSSPLLSEENLKGLKDFLSKDFETIVSKEQKAAVQQNKNEISWDVIEQTVTDRDMRLLTTLLKTNGAENLMKVTNPSGKTILHLACERGVYQIIHVLLKKGANTNQKTKTGVTPFYSFICHFKEKESWQTLQTYLPPIMSRLMDPAQIHLLDSNGNNILHFLVYVGAYQQVVDALEAGADPELKNSKGQVPMDLIFEYVKEAQTVAIPGGIMAQNSVNITNALYPAMTPSPVDDERWMRAANDVEFKPLFNIFRDFVTESSDILFYEDGLLDFPASLKGFPPNSISVLKGATPEELFPLLMAPESDEDSMKAFLCGYEKYFSPIELCNSLFELVETDAAPRLIDFYEVWFTTLPKDFTSISMKSLLSLSAKEIGKKYPQFNEKVEAFLTVKKKKKEDKMFRDLMSRLKAKRGKSKMKEEENVLCFLQQKKFDEAFPLFPSSAGLLNGSVDMKIVARLLSVWNFYLHAQVKTKDIIEYLQNQASYMKRSGSKKKNLGVGEKGKEKRTTIQTAIDFFSETTYWAASLILATPDEFDQVKVSEELLNLVHECWVLKNFNSAYAILSCFQINGVYRLKGLIPSLSPTQAALYQRYTNLFSSQKSYKNYRNAHAAAESPTVGYCGLLLRDIVYMADSQPDYLDKGRRLINFAKLRSLYSRIQQDHMRNYSVPYEMPSEIPENALGLLSSLYDINTKVDLDLLLDFSKYKYPNPSEHILPATGLKSKYDSLRGSSKKRAPIMRQRSGGIVVSSTPSSPVLSLAEGGASEPVRRNQRKKPKQRGSASFTKENPFFQASTNFQYTPGEHSVLSLTQAFGLDPRKPVDGVFPQNPPPLKKKLSSDDVVNKPRSATQIAKEGGSISVPVFRKEKAEVVLDKQDTLSLEGQEEK